MNTLWGKAQTINKLKRGFYYVTTAEHGGYMVSKKLAEKNIPDILNHGFVGSFYHGYYHFEEDCAYAVLEYYLLIKHPNNPLSLFVSMFRLPDFSKFGESLESLKTTVSTWYPELV